MKAITKLLAGGVAIAALACAAPAAAQMFPGMGYPGYGVPGYGYPGYPAYQGYNVPGASRVAASQCSAAVQQRLGGYGAYGGYGYGYGGGYGGAYGRGLSIDSIEIAAGGGYRVRGVASAGGYGYGGIRFTCRTDPRGLVTAVHFNNNRFYGSNYGPAYGNPYSVYGYQRY